MLEKQPFNYINNEKFIAYYNKRIDKYIVKIVVDRKNIFLCLNESEFNKNFDFSNNEVSFMKPKFVKLKIFIMLLGIASIILTLFLFREHTNDINFNNSFLSGSFMFSLLWLVLNIYLHEMAHIKTLNMLGGYTKGMKFRFTMCIFPTFFVDTSDSYLLAKIDRVLVYMAGLFFNALLSLILYFIIITFNLPFLYLGFELVVIPIIFNLIPLLNTDGYNVLLAMINVYPFEKSRKNPIMVTLLRYITYIGKIILVLSIIKNLLL